MPHVNRHPASPLSLTIALEPQSPVHAPLPSPLRLKTRTLPAPTALRFRAFSDALLTHPATGLDPNYSPNPTRPLEPLDEKRLLKLEHRFNNAQLKAYRSGKPASSYPCPFCHLGTVGYVIQVNDSNTLCVFRSIDIPTGWEMHLLCIPVTQPGRAHITNVADLNQSHLPLLREMKDFATRVLGEVLRQNGMPIDTQFFLQVSSPGSAVDLPNSS